MSGGDRQWFCVVSKPQQELYARQHILRQGVECYVPLTHEKPNTRAKAIVRPLFARYLFARTNGQWRFLENTYGVTGLVMIGPSPAPVTDGVIEGLRAREQKDGLIVLPTKPLFKPGDRVVVNGGPFDGLQGLYQGQTNAERQTILLNMLNRRVTVHVGLHQLKAQ